MVAYKQGLQRKVGRCALFSQHDISCGSYSNTYSRLPSLHFPYIRISRCLVTGTDMYFKLQECVIYLESFHNYYQLKM